MCEFCIQHGEGKRWYLEAKNYSEELLNEERKQAITAFYEGDAQGTINSLGALDKLLTTDPAAARALFPTIVEHQKKGRWGQVVPLEEVEQILDMRLSVVRLPCPCRAMLRGFGEARYCFGLGPTQSDFKFTSLRSYPDLSSSFEVLTTEETKKAFQKLDRSGLVHTVWTMITPYISAICNCSVNECMPFKNRTQLGLPTLFKAEYVSSIDWEKCDGCRDCMKLCSFGAISYSAAADRCSVNQLKCYGCGVCRALCARDAITLLDRSAIPALANEW